MSVLNPPAKIASRAIGAQFFSFFGGAWLVGGSLQLYGARLDLLSLIAMGTAALFFLSRRKFLQNRSAYLAEAQSPERIRIQRSFRIVNAAQWGLVFLAGVALAMLNRDSWFLPVMIFIIGAHFFPLGVIFQNRWNYVVGTAVVLLAVLYPFFGGPGSPVGCLGMGIILWVNTIWALGSRNEA